MSESPYTDAILDYLADQEPHTIAEIREGIKCRDGAGIPQLLRNLMWKLSEARDQKKLITERIDGKLHYRITARNERNPLPEPEKQDNLKMTKENTAPLYVVKDWQKLFENNRSRTVENLRWVCVPNKHDGEGYATVMEQENAAELFAAWVLILQVASKCQERGTLMREDGTPMTAKTLAMKTRAEKSWFEDALNFFTTKVKWLECQVTVSQVSPDRHPTDRQVTKKEGREWKGSEGNSPEREEFPELESEALAKQGKSLESIASRLAIPAEALIKHGKTLGLTETKVRQWADSRVANNWSTPKGRALGPMTWPADMNNFAAASNEISQKQNNGKNHTTANRNDGTANAGRASAFAGIGKRRPEL